MKQKQLSRAKRTLSSLTFSYLIVFCLFFTPLMLTGLIPIQEVNAQEQQVRVRPHFVAELNNLIVQRSGDLGYTSFINNIPGDTRTLSRGDVPGIQSLGNRPAHEGNDMIRLFQFDTKLQRENDTTVYFNRYTAYLQPFDFEIMFRTHGTFDEWTITEGFAWYYNQWIGRWTDPRSMYQPGRLAAPDLAYKASFSDAEAYADDHWTGMIANRKYSDAGHFYDVGADAYYDIDAQRYIAIPQQRYDNATTSQVHYSQLFTLRMEAGVQEYQSGVLLGFDPYIDLVGVRSGEVMTLDTTDDPYLDSMDDDPEIVGDDAGNAAPTGSGTTANVIAAGGATSSPTVNTNLMSMGLHLQTVNAPKEVPYAVISPGGSLPINPLEDSVVSRTIPAIPSPVYNAMPEMAFEAKYRVTGDLQCGFYASLQNWQWNCFAQDAKTDTAWFGPWGVAGEGSYYNPTAFPDTDVHGLPSYGGRTGGFPMEVPRQYFMRDVYTSYRLRAYAYYMVPETLYGNSAYNLTNTFSHQQGFVPLNEPVNRVDVVDFDPGINLNNTGIIVPHEEPTDFWAGITGWFFWIIVLVIVIVVAYIVVKVYRGRGKAHAGAVYVGAPSGPSYEEVRRQVKQEEEVKRLRKRITAAGL